MPRYIDADKLMETIKTHHYPLVVKGLNSTDYGMFTLGIQQAVDEQPTVDAEPVRHGRWMERTKEYPDLPNDSTYIYECSECGYTDTHGANVEVPYCWHCGADMREEEE